MDFVGRVLEERGVVCDVRRPGVISVAPVPLCRTWMDVWGFVLAFGEALRGCKGRCGR